MNDGPYRERPPRPMTPRQWKFWTCFISFALVTGVPVGILARGVGAAVYGWANKTEPCSEKFGRTPERGYSATCDNGARLEVQNGGEFYQCKCPGAEK